jgi:hypothetical protein
METSTVLVAGATGLLVVKFACQSGEYDNQFEVQHIPVDALQLQ